MGRKPKITPGGLREQALLDALKLGMTRHAAAGTCDISYSTFWRMLDDARFREAVEKAEQWAEGRFTGIVAKAAETQWQAAAWWLERRKWEDFARHEKVEMVVDVRRELERVAQQEGLDADALMAEAERILTPA